MCNNLLNYKNAYNQNSFLDLNQNASTQIKEEWKNNLEKYKKYHDNKLIKSTLDFLKNNYITEEGLVNHYERYVDKIYEASELDTPKRYQGE